MSNIMVSRLWTLSRHRRASVKERLRCLPSYSAFAVNWIFFVALGIASLEGCTPVPLGNPTLVQMQAAAAPTVDLPKQCAARYAALLDLAGLARSYGSSSGIYLDALGAMADQLDECLSGGAERGREGFYQMHDRG
ncbi:hypothetical protein [Paraburkholderia rhizosphaerae]|uniref:Uncharacterized protein n=1 Tax=Paraburkholderia rhizosphaerae TaxID=480658 RepID=A0A4R8LV17_9BURK|nr:hypothetical protein [Paraburkholderia rhizosphaerae]TDY50982.1 hypothetical protein BX592_108219 [Paraburkholderia rhizosphaerae]